MKFRLLAGFHVCADKTRPKISFSPETREEHKIYPDRRYKAGDVIETDEDLHAIFDQDGIPPKFQRVDEYMSDGFAQSHTKDGLEDLTVNELKELAEIHEVDLKSATKKDAICSILRAYGVKPDPVSA